MNEVRASSTPYQLIDEHEGRPAKPHSAPREVVTECPGLSTAFTKGSALWEDLKKDPGGVKWADARTGFTAAYIVSGLIQKKMLSYGTVFCS
jgi:hypothetical protein